MLPITWIPKIANEVGSHPLFNVKHCEHGRLRPKFMLFSHGHKDHKRYYLSFDLASADLSVILPALLLFFVLYFSLVTRKIDGIYIRSSI